MRGFDLNLAPFASHDVEVPVHVQQIAHNGFGFRLLGLRRRRRGFPLGGLLRFRRLRRGRHVFRHARHVIGPGALDLQRLVVHEHQGLDAIPVAEFFRDLGLVRGFDLNLAPLAPHDVEVPVHVQQIAHNGFGFRLLGLRRRCRGFPLGGLLGFRRLRRGCHIFRHARHVIGSGALDLQRLVVHEHQRLDAIPVSEFFRDLGFMRGFDLNLAVFTPHDVEVPVNVQQVGHDGLGGLC